MDTLQQVRGEQSVLWNGPAGHAWVHEQVLLDEILRPFENLLVQSIPAACTDRVLDIGCGTGSTTLAIARRLGCEGQCIGLDISEPMITAAQARAKKNESTARFVCADVQRHPFEPASADRIVSRFGVMFFDEPVSAFANLRLAAVHAAELRFVAWRSAAENAFMTTAERAAAPLLPNLPARKKDAPGQFAFGDKERVRSILAESHWGQIEIVPIDIECIFPESALLGYINRLGPVGLTLQELDDDTRIKVVERVREAFEPFVAGEQVRFAAACWMVSANASD